MKIDKLLDYIDGLFLTRNNNEFNLQSGITFKSNDEVFRIGYCTNLTPDTIDEAKKFKVDLIITHHDAWDFLFGLKDTCKQKLIENGISHYYNHLPLDDCDFGTNDSLIERLGFIIKHKTHEFKGFYCGRVAELDNEISLNDLVKKLEDILLEPVKFWKFNNKGIKRIGLVCGGGGATSDVKEAVDNDCDVYITSEKVLYTIQYAKYANINLIIGSHTFTESFGIESLARKIKNNFEDIEIVKIIEEHIEY